MEKNVRKSKDKYLILEIILVLVFTIFFDVYVYYDNKIKEFNELYNNSEKILINKRNELNDLKNIESFDVDGQIVTTKNEYFKLIKELEDKILDGTSNKKIAYLTFDDGPYYNTYKVLDILDKYNVKATFFTTSINGENCYDKRSENCLVLYKEYLKRGHTIANHTYTHSIFKGLYKSSDSFIKAVIDQENKIKEQTDGYITNIVRFPGGSNSAGNKKNEIIAKLKERKYGWVDWTAIDGDGGNLKSKEQAWKNIKSTINDKIEVVLLHDYSSITTSILPELIEYLEKNGYILLPLFYESNMINK